MLGESVHHGANQPETVVLILQGRMSFEIIFILAAALDRILVLPPEQPMCKLKLSFPSSTATHDNNIAPF